MDKRLKEICDNYEKLRIGVDEPFRFHCTMCGRCCIHREDILLTPRDLYNVAKELRITPEEFVLKYGETYIGGDSRFPIVRIKPRGSIKRCPLLKDRKCSVHNAKPAVCAMFPIGRCVRLDAATESVEDIREEKVEYIFIDPGCGDKSETHTVKEWFSEFGMLINDEYFVKWQKILMGFSTILKQAEKKLSKDIMEHMWTLIYAALYLNYDMEKDFMPQFETNAEKLSRIISLLPKMEGET